MLRMRLRRMGSKKKPTYRVVVAEARSPRDGAFIEIVGHYNPRTEPSTIVFNEDRAKHWLSHGVQPSDRVAKLLVVAGIADLETSATQAEARAAAAKAAAAKAEKAAAAKAPAAKPAKAVSTAKAAPAETVAEEAQAEETTTSEAE